MTVLLAVTLASMLLAIVMSIVAWRAAREERMRSDARVAALAADIEDAVAAAGGRRAEPAPLYAVRPARPASSNLFAATPASASSRSVVVVGIGLFAFATAVALAVVLTSGASRPPTGPANRANPANSANPANPTRPALGPLALVALGHEREGDRLIVRGVVRNPSTARADGLTAVVFLFDRDGQFLSSGRAPPDAALPPGGESTFAVTIRGARNVARYRVSFRTETAIVPHVDRRHAE